MPPPESPSFTSKTGKMDIPGPCPKNGVSPAVFFCVSVPMQQTLMAQALGLLLTLAGVGTGVAPCSVQVPASFSSGPVHPSCLGTIPTPAGCAPRDRSQGGAAFGAALLRLPQYGRLLVGAPKQSRANLFRQGAVWIYGGAPQGLAVQGLLFAPQPASGDQFGTALAGDSGWVAIGAPLANGASSHSGIVHLYSEKPAGLRHAQVLAPSGVGLLSYFGVALHMQAERLIVGAPQQMGASGAFQQGSAWIYSLHNSGWEPDLRFDPPDARPGALAGSAVLLMGNLAFVGAPTHDGAAPASGGVWVLEARGGVWLPKDLLIPPNPQPDAHFGSALASSGDWLAVGAPGPEGGSGAGGSVHLFRVNQMGIIHERFVQAPSHDAREFGRALASCEGGFLVGAPGGDGMVMRLETAAQAVQAQCLLVGEAASAAGIAVQEGFLPKSFLAGEPGGASSTSSAARRGGLLHMDPGILPSPRVAVGDLTLGLHVCGNASLQGWTSPVEPDSLWRLMATSILGGAAQEVLAGMASSDGHIHLRGELGFLAAGPWELHLELTLLGGQPGTSDVHSVVLP